HREYSDSSSRWNHRQLSIPERNKGLVRLQLTFPWFDLTNGRQFLSVAIVWPKTGRELPSPKLVAEKIIESLKNGDFERTEQTSRVGKLTKVRVSIQKWEAEVFIRHADRSAAELLRKQDGRDAAFVNLFTAIEWASRFFKGNWPRDTAKFEWIY